jgi:hypothetical protein
MIKKSLFILFIALLMLLPARAVAADGIKITDSHTRAEFPERLSFTVKAESPSTINRIRLLYEVDQKTYAPSYAEAWPAFQPSQKVTASWNWDMRRSWLPPGARVTYWWVIEDAGGNRLTSPRQALSFDDTRFKWQKIGDDKISIYWYKGSQSFANALLQSAREAAVKLGQDTGVSFTKPVSYYIYGSQDDLLSALIAPDEWTGGQANPDFNIITIGISPNNLDWGKRAVAHELGHLITNEVIPGPFSAYIPLWLKEGLANHAEGEQSDADKQALVKAIKNGRTATLRTLSSPFPADWMETAYAYAQSQSVVEYLINAYGKDKVNRLLVTLNEGNTINDALTAVYGFNLSQLDEAWTEYMLGQEENKVEPGKVLMQTAPGNQPYSWAAQLDAAAYPVFYGVN